MATFAPCRRAKQNWSHKLARPLALDNGMKLTTLADARTTVLYVFGSGDVRSGALDHTIRRLPAAATTGKRANIAAATDQIERVLRDRRILADR